jgi:hypothetical protein
MAKKQLDILKESLAINILLQFVIPIHTWAAKLF